MIVSRETLKPIIKSLIEKDKHQMAWDLLDHYASYAKGLQDFDILGEVALIAKHYDLYLRAAEITYTHSTTSEQLFSARENLYKAYNTMNYPDKAMRYIDLNLRLKPNDFETLSQKGFTLALMGKRKEAEDILGSLVAYDEKSKEGLEYAMSGKQLREGQTARGIINFINTFKPRNHLFMDQLKMKLWDGGPVPGQTIVVNDEGGVGDTLINIRFFKQLEELGMTPILYTPWYKQRPDIIELFRRHGYRVESNSMFFNKDWLWTHFMALPGFLGLTENDLWWGPYLFPLRNPKNKLNDNNFKIGIKCNGNPYFEQDIYRKIPIDEMLAVLPKNASIYYFDKEKTHPATINLKDRLNTWDDTLDLLDQMDIVLSSCTSLVHASSAMGKDTIVLVPISKYYTWTSTRTDESTPWYSYNTKVIEQTVVRSWKEPLERANQLIKEKMNNG